jgi:hypothetical protein
LARVRRRLSAGLDAAVAGVAERVEAEGNESGRDEAEQERPVGLMGEVGERAVEADCRVRSSRAASRPEAPTFSTIA